MSNKQIEKETGTFTWNDLKVFIDGKELLVDSMELTYEIESYFLGDLSQPKSIARLEITTTKKEEENVKQANTQED